MPDNPNRAPGSAYGAPFIARLVQAYGIDYGESRRTLVLEMEDGCRRQFRTESLSDADNALIDSEIAKRPTTPDPATYRIKYSNPDTSLPLTSPELVSSGKLNLYETQHFAFWYGNGNDDSYDFARTIAAQGRTREEVIRETAVWFEQQWFINRDVVGAPMPFANEPDKQKLNVYLCGTGRPNADGDYHACGASAAQEMSISAWALGKGSMVITHEFGHMIQFYTGGFRGRPEAGPIWETGANWNAYVVSPHWTEAGYYLNNLENGPLFSTSRYAAYPFMSYLYENDRTRNLVFDVWKTAIRQGAWSSVTKDFVDTLVREGQKTGAYPQGLVSFADDMGWYGARLVAMDFLNQRNMLDAQQPTRTTHFQGHRYTPLARVTTDPAVFAPPVERSLLEWGTHLIPLTSGGQTVKVSLTGATRAASAAWRFSIVAVKDGDVPVYSALGKVDGTATGSTSLAVPAAAKLYLAVTATPYRYESLGWQQDGAPVKGTRFPYTVKIEGATPRTGPVNLCDIEAQPGTWTSNYTLNNNREGIRPC